ncbi:hypothetical protein BCR39DRAFT_547036 [Naematelia encephala]|uniref:Histone H1 n=1 Tax=Naematelia encephala TaxID=71784 RepID=A0A1Y2AQ10_9TREE|nr:hypothetical protein BCR39DRAFT_547036 [Naematelia encephala]
MAPVKKAAAPKKTSSASHPTFLDMVLAAVKGHPESARTGVSRPQIKKFLVDTYKIDMSSASNVNNLSNAIKRGAGKGYLTLPKGASGRVKVAAKKPAAGKENAPPKTAAKKPAAKPKVAAKPAVKKTTAAKPAAAKKTAAKPAAKKAPAAKKPAAKKTSAPKKAPAVKAAAKPAAKKAAPKKAAPKKTKA